MSTPASARGTTGSVSDTEASQPTTQAADTIPPIITVVGATATGKSDLALDLADHLGGEIVNTDAMQFYRGMDIGTAKLPPAQRRGIDHHLIDILDVTDEANVQTFQEQARTAIAEIRARGHRPILVGGSGLYARAATDRLDFPGTDATVRSRLEGEVDADRWAAHARLADLDPVAAEKITVNDVRRIVRALEVIELTGRPFTASLPEYTEIEPTIHIGLALDRHALHDRIARRVDLMWEAGWVDEVRTLLDRGLAEREDRLPGHRLRPDPGLPRRHHRRRCRPRIDDRAHPPVRPPPGHVVPPRPAHHLDRLRRHRCRGPAQGSTVDR